MSDALEARRLRRADLEAVAALRNACRPAAEPLTAGDILLSLSQTGYLLAWQGPALCGALAWSAENLAARLDAAYLAAGAPADTLPLLLETVEAEARVLNCEVILLDAAEAELAGAALARGYAAAAPAGLPPAWREAAGTATQVLLKRLSEGRARRPV